MGRNPRRMAKDQVEDFMARTDQTNERLEELKAACKLSCCCCVGRIIVVWPGRLAALEPVWLFCFNVWLPCICFTVDRIMSTRLNCARLSLALLWPDLLGALLERALLQALRVQSATHHQRNDLYNSKQGSPTCAAGQAGSFAKASKPLQPRKGLSC